MERIYQLWDELADAESAGSDTAFLHLLGTLCELVSAQDAVWLDATHMPDLAPGDPVHGWRPRRRGSLVPSEITDEMAAQQLDMMEKGEIDIATVRNVEQAGSLRVNRILDLAGPAWFKGDYYQNFYVAVGYSDAICVGCPINEDVELYIYIFRSLGEPRFTEEERDIVAFAMRGVKWLLRQYLLGQGLLVARTPLTPAERRVLKELLKGSTEKQIAATLVQSPHTTHDHVKRIYQKFGVANRAGLSALWLGHA